MRILLLNYEYPPVGGGGGVATAALARGLTERGASVDVVTTGSSLRHDHPGAEHPRLRLHRVRSWRQGVHQAGMAGAAGYLVGALPLVRRLLRRHRYDLVQVFFSLPTGALLPFLGLGGTPLVLSLRGSDVPGHLPDDGKLEAAHRVLRPLTRWIWRRADRIVVVSESLGREARRTMPGLLYSVIGNGVDLERFRPPSAQRRDPEGAVRCLAVGRLVACKGLDTLLRALGSLADPRLRLEVVGSGPAEGELRRLAAELGLAQRVTFSGAMDADAVAARHREADLFTMAPSAESFGIAFAEALASGLPVVGSRVGGIPEFIEDGGNGFLVPPGEPEPLAQAIHRLADDPELRREIGLRNRARAEATLSWRRMVERHVELYRELTGRPFGAAAELSPAARPLVTPTSSGR